MTERVIGPTGSRRRRRFLLAPVFAVVLIALVLTAGGQALPVGVFELDKNAADDPAGGADDWNNVYAQISADANDTGDDDKCIALGAVECSFVSDLDGHSIFTTGGSKDDLDIPNWRHKTGNVPPKDEITNAYAAKYISGGHEILYFGADRFAQNGSADFGFWFFRNEVSMNADGTFSGVHTGSLTTPGDILILGTFTQGGATSNIRVFKWVGTGGNATSNGTVEGPTGAFGDCVPGGGAGVSGCGTVNNELIQVAWPYTPSQGAAGSIPSGGFVEGGIDLSDPSLNLAGCFRSFMAETRSSPSVDATLKDFVLGNFEACDSSLTTTPKNGTGGALGDADSDGLPDLSIGTGSVSVTDSAVLDVSGSANFTGTLSFNICGPIAAPATCATGGVPIASVSNPITADGTYSSAAATLTSVGRYCWRANFTSGTTGVPSAFDSSLGECFEVLPVTPPLATQAGTTPVNLGAAVTDTATLSGTATQPGTNGGTAGTYLSINATNGAVAGGKITFTLLKADCSTLATGAGTNPQDVTVSGNNTYGPVSFIPDLPGTYHWKAQYFPAAGDVNNVGSTHNGSCTETNETVVVNKAPTEISTSQSVYPNDSATVSVAAANQGTGNVQGSVKFRLYDSLANCQATTPSDIVGTGGLLYSQTVNLPGNAFSSTVGTSNSTVAVSTDTTVYWLVEFTSTNTAQFGRNSICVENTQTTFVNDAGPGSAP